MKKQAAIDHYGSQAAVARVLNISRAAVSIWAGLVPIRSAWKLAKLTNGRLSVDVDAYRDKALKRRRPPPRASVAAPRP